jgi:hypothetical protein
MGPIYLAKGLQKLTSLQKWELTTPTPFSIHLQQLRVLKSFHVVLVAFCRGGTIPHKAQLSLIVCVLPLFAVALGSVNLENPIS